MNPDKKHEEKPEPPMVESPVDTTHAPMAAAPNPPPPKNEMPVYDWPQDVTNGFTAKIMRDIIGEVWGEKFGYTLHRFCRFCLKLPQNPFRTVVAAAVAGFNDGVKTSGYAVLKGDPSSERNQAIYRQITKMITGMMSDYDTEIHFLAVGELWGLGLDDDQGDALCSLNANGEEFGLSQLMWKYEAVMALGVDELMDDSVSEKDRLKAKWLDRKIQDLIAFKSVLTKVQIPTIYFVNKTKKQIEILKKKKRALIGVDIGGEPIRSANVVKQGSEDPFDNMLEAD